MMRIVIKMQMKNIMKIMMKNMIRNMMRMIHFNSNAETFIDINLPRYIS